MQMVRQGAVHDVGRSRNTPKGHFCHTGMCGAVDRNAAVLGPAGETFDL